MFRPYKKLSYQAHNSDIYITKVSLTAPSVKINNSVLLTFRNNYLEKATNSVKQSSNS